MRYLCTRNTIMKSITQTPITTTSSTAFTHVCTVSWTNFFVIVEAVNIFIITRMTNKVFTVRTIVFIITIIVIYKKLTTFIAPFYLVATFIATKALPFVWFDSRNICIKKNSLSQSKQKKVSSVLKYGGRGWRPGFCFIKSGIIDHDFGIGMNDIVLCAILFKIAPTFLKI